MSEHIRASVSDGVKTIHFARPEKKNAITVDMYTSLVHELRSGDEAAEVRVLLLTGEGAAFTSGNDLMDFMNTPPQGPDSPVVKFLETITTLKKPFLAAVNGPAVGIGVTVLLHTDMAWASENATFHMPFVNLGVCPEAASTYLLPRMVGRARASEILFFGEKFGAYEAREIGLIVGVLPEEKLLETVTEKARILAKKAPGALRATKELLAKGSAQAVRDAMEAEGLIFMEQLVSPEAREAFTAFFEKRDPDFSQFD